MATLQELQQAFLNADKAGDTASAQVLADAIRQSSEPAPAASKERTFGEAATDIGAGVVSGLGSLVQTPGQLYGLATGNFDKTGFLGMGKDIQEAGESFKSSGLKAREAARDIAVKKAEEKGQMQAFGSAISETLKDPALLTSFLSEQVPQLLLPLGAAKVVGGAIVRGAVRGAEALGTTAAKEAAIAAGKEAAVGAGARAAVGAAAVQQGADVGAQSYEDIYKKLIEQGAPPEEAADRAINLARAAGVSGAIISVLAQRLPGARTIEHYLAGGKEATTALRGAVKGAFGEGVSEVAEEGGGQFSQNLAMRDVDPTQSLTAGLGKTAGMAALGGVGLGGSLGALSSRGPQAAAPGETTTAGTPTDLQFQAQANREARLRRAEEQGAPEIPEGQMSLDLQPPEKAPVYPTPTPEEAAAFAETRSTLVDQYDTLNREISRLKTQHDAAATPEEQAKLNTAAEPYFNALTETRTKILEIDSRIGGIEKGDVNQAALNFEPQQEQVSVPQTTEAVQAETQGSQPTATVAPIEQPVPEPTVLRKLTPETVPTVVSPQVLGTLGIGPTAILRKADHPIQGLDIAKPEDAAQVKQMLDVYKEKRSQGIKDKIDTYLARPEFQPAPVEAPVAPAVAYKKSRKVAAPVVEAPVVKAPVIKAPVVEAPIAPTVEAVPEGKYTIKAAENLLVNAHDVPRRVAKAMIDDISDDNGYVSKKDLGKQLQDVEAEVAKGEKKPNPYKYKLAEEGVVKSDRAAVERLANKLTSDWDRAPEIITVQSITDLPPRLQEQITKDEVKPQGAFDPDTKTVYLIADNIQQGDGTAVGIVIAHEALGHFGLRSILGGKYAGTMQAIYDGNSSVRKAADARISPTLDLYTAVEEVLADKAERGERINGIQKIILAIKQFLIRHGVPLKNVTDGQILQLIAQASRYVRKNAVPQFVAIEPTKGARAAMEAKIVYKAGEDAVPGTASVSKEFGPETVRAIEEIQSKVPPEAQASTKSFVGSALGGIKDARENSSIVATFRQAAVDKYATVESHISKLFGGAVKDYFGNINPFQYVRQAEDSAKIIMDFFRAGGIRVNKDGLVETYNTDSSMVKVFTQIGDLAKREGMTYDGAKSFVSKILEGHRLFSINKEHNLPLERSAAILERQGKTKEAAAERSKVIDLHMDLADINTAEQVYQSSASIKAIQDTMNTTRTDAINLMEALGRINKETADFWRENKAYVPFDRVFEDSEKGPLRFVRGQGLAVLKNFPGMEGSLGRPVKNVFDSYAKRLGSMIEDAMKNNASVKLLQTMADAGFAKELLNPDQATNKNLVVPRLFVDGKPVHFEVQNQYDMLAFQQAPEITNFLVKGLGAFTRALRISITATPMFAVKQVVEDAQRAMTTSGVKHPFVVAARTLYNFPRILFSEVMGRKLPMIREMERVGIIGAHGASVYNPVEDIQKNIGVTKRGIGEAILHKLEKITLASDLAARLAVYEQTLLESGGTRAKDGSIEGGDALLAQHRARELINFSRQGASPTMRNATRMIAFFNSYAQGLDVLYRSASGIDSTTGLERTAARRMFWSRVSLLTAMGLAYAMMMQDDKDYQGTDDSVRDNNWILPDGNKFPVAKELAFLYKTIPERIVNYMHRMGTPEEQGALDALGGLAKAGLSAYSSPTAVPNLIKPILENLTNYSFFKQGALVPASQQKIEAGYQTAPGTSELAKAIGKLSTNGPVQVSPIKLDNLINGILGMAGATTLQMTDAVLNPTRADRPVYKLPFASIFTYDKIGNRATSEFYDLEHKVQEAKSTYDALKQKDPEAAGEYGDKHAALIELAPKLTPVLKRLNDTRKLIAMLEAGDEAMVGKMTGAQLREEIDALRKDMSESLDFVREVSNEIKKE